MKYAKRLVSLFLLLSITAGSTAALAAEDVQITASDSQAPEESLTIVNPSTQITWIDYMYGDSESEGVQLWTNFHRTKEADSVLYRRPATGEFAAMYRSVNHSKFTDNPQDIYLWAQFSYDGDDDDNADPKDNVILVQDDEMKNGNYYKYKLATMFRESEDQEPITIACSKPVSVYYLKSMYSSRIRLRNSANGKTIKLSWNKERNTKADGYQLYYVHKTKSNRWSKPITRKVKGNKTTHITLKNRTPGKDYRFQICSYKKYRGKTYYGNYSNYIFRY